MIQSNYENIAKKYCSGCGLCSEIDNVLFEKNSLGFTEAKLDGHNLGFCKEICPAFNSAFIFPDYIWGSIQKSYLGWSSDSYIREKASSGGAITTIAIYLLESGLVDGVIQTMDDPTIPYKTITICSKTREEIIGACGSRYAESAPLTKISEILQKGNKFAFVGKPCDVYSLRKYSEQCLEVQQKVLYYLSFFCAGTPSEKANRKLISTLLNDEPCSQLNYRGNGWPGKVVAKGVAGKVECMSYEESWGGILGRDVRKLCRFCVDGIGLFADVACCDAWFIDINGKPDFSEHNGRNAILARTEKGCQLVDDVIASGFLTVEKFENHNELLKKMQTYQFTRRTCMYDMLNAMKISGKNIPAYPTKQLRKLAKKGDLKLRGRKFIGIIKRVIKGRI